MSKTVGLFSKKHIFPGIFSKPVKNPPEFQLFMKGSRDLPEVSRNVLMQGYSRLLGGADGD